MPTIFVAVLYYMIGFNNSLYAYAMFIFISNLIANCGMSFGYMISCLAPSTKIAIALSSPLILPLLLFGGFFINNSSIPFVFDVFKYISWFYYGNEALVIVQWKGITNITCSSSNVTLPETLTTTNTAAEHRCLTTGLAVIEELSFNVNNLLLDIAILLVLIFVMRLLAFLALYRKSKQR